MQPKDSVKESAISLQWAQHLPRLLCFRCSLATSSIRDLFQGRKNRVPICGVPNGQVTLVRNLSKIALKPRSKNWSVDIGEFPAARCFNCLNLTFHPCIQLHPGAPKSQVISFSADSRLLEAGPIVGLNVLVRFDFICP